MRKEKKKRSTSGPTAVVKFYRNEPGACSLARLTASQKWKCYENEAAILNEQIGSALPCGTAFLEEAKSVNKRLWLCCKHSQKV